MVRFILPWPTSTNTNWRAGNGAIYLSKKYRNFLKQSAIEIKATVWSHQWKPFSPRDRLAVRIVLFPPDYRVFDVDNRAKAILDTFTRSGIWKDDSCVDLLILQRGYPTPSGRAIVEIFQTNQMEDPEKYGLPVKTRKKGGETSR